ncbi:MAG: lipopolysaccharide kinase InaA family protein [Duncaniella sp.]|nr:lipopolysaccharide kinase InaA family protein [Duncaniella sp.]
MESFKIVVNPRYEHLRPYIIPIIKGQRPDGSKEFFRVRNSLYKTTVSGTDIVVKDFKKPNFINSYVYTNLRKSKACRSYENALRLLEAGFNTPEPIAYGEHKVNGRLVNCYYISSELKNATEIRNWTGLSCVDTLLPAFAEEIVRLHKSGIYNKDFTGGNVLFTGNAVSGYKFHYVDLNRIKFGEHRSRILLRMLGSIANPDYTETRRIARLYAESAGMIPDKIESIAVKELDKYLNTRKIRSYIKSLFKK